jgi:hypothetical protein
MRVVGCFDRGASAARVHATCFSRARAAEVKAPGARRGIAMAVRVRGDGRAGGRRAVCGERASTPHRGWLGTHEPPRRQPRLGNRQQQQQRPSTASLFLRHGPVRLSAVCVCMAMRERFRTSQRRRGAQECFRLGHSITSRPHSPLRGRPCKTVPVASSQTLHGLGSSRGTRQRGVQDAPRESTKSLDVARPAPTQCSCSTDPA